MLNLFEKITDKECMILRTLTFITVFSLLASCSHTPVERMPADTGATGGTCQELAQNLFLKDNYEADLQKALIDKKLITFTNKFVVVEHPKMNWINRARISLNQSIKNWNNNKYPAFYIFSNEDVVTEAKKYFQTLSSIVNPDQAVDPSATKNLETVQSWMKSFSSYQKDLDQLLEERISLQYNLSLLKKVKLKKDEVRDIKISIQRNGALVEEVLTLRKNDKDLDYQIKRLKEEIKELDGTLLKNGKIKERVMRQAMLKDMLTIVQREFEYSLKNTASPHADLLKEFEELNALIKTSSFEPSTYGVYRITNQVFIRELASLTKMDVAYKKFVETPALKLKEVVDAFIQNRAVRDAANPTEAEKIGFFKRVYAKITSITPKQAAIGGSAVVVAGIGFDRYFTLKDNSLTPLPERTHEEQMERTAEEDVRRSEAHSQAIEVHIEELTK